MRARLLLSTLCLCASAASAFGQTCKAQSPEQQALLVELYTSEGCNSCPPADRWLSTLKGRPGVLAAAFHVDYWDRLGWTDRFGSAVHSQRQAEQQRSSGARFSYTPQVLVNGRDWRGWPTLPLVEQVAAVRIDLRRQDAGRVSVQVTPLRGTPARLALWWVLLEDGHATAVAAGENRGAALQHDHVVRRYGQLPAWAAASPAPALTLAASADASRATNGEGGHKARLLVVVVDAATGMPLQAAQLAC